MYISRISGLILIALVLPQMVVSIKVCDSTSINLSCHCQQHCIHYGIGVDVIGPEKEDPFQYFSLVH